jgi:hypothetical protein
MDLYGISLATGATGLVIMAVGGLSHGLGHGHAGHGHAAHASHAGDSHQSGSHGSSWTSALLSPRVLFALLVGFGAGGLLATPLGEPWRAGAAILGAAALEGLLVGPLWRFLFRFESSPATTLDSSLDDEARAVSGFDVHGNGLVALATLESEELGRGVRIRSGDTVRIAAVDATRGSCTVRQNDR